MAPKGADNVTKLFNPNQPRDPHGHWSPGDGSDADVVPIAGRSPPPPKSPPPPQPKLPGPASKPPSSAGKKNTEDILMPGGKELGERKAGAGAEVRTVTQTEFDGLKTQLLDGAQEIAAPGNYAGKWYQRGDGTVVGVRESAGSGTTLEVVQGNAKISNGYKVHKK